MSTVAAEGEMRARKGRQRIDEVLVVCRCRRVYLVLALALIIYVVSFNSALYSWGDDAHYMIVANSVADGHGLRDVLFPNRPAFPYPIPLFPLALAPIVAVSGYALTPPKILVLVTAVAAIYWTYRLFRTTTSESAALLVALMAAVSPQIVSFSHQVMTEVPYLLLSLMALFFLARYEEEDHWRRRSGVVSAGLLVAAILLRSIGVALLIAAVARLLFERRHVLRTRVKKVLMLGIVCGCSWFAVNVSTLGRIPYVGEFRHGTVPTESGGGVSLAERVRGNVRGYWDAVPEVVLSPLYRHRLDVLALLLIAVIGAGLVTALVRSRTLIEYYALTYALVLLIYPPSNSGNLRRYLVPVIPFILYYFVRGCYWTAAALRSSLQRSAAASLPARRTSDWLPRLAVGIIALHALTNLIDTARSSRFGDLPEMFDYSAGGDFDGHRAMAMWARSNTADDSVVAVEDAYGFAFWSHRQVEWYPDLPPGADRRTTVAQFMSQNVNYVAVDQLNEGADSPSQLVRHHLAQSPANFLEVYRNGQNVLYRVIGGTG